jgi:hypothetical protein
MARGPIDPDYTDKRRLTSATVELRTGLTESLKLQFATHWLRGETDNDVKARFLRLAAHRIGDLYEQLVENAELLEDLSTLDPDDPAWSNSAATNDNGRLDANLPQAVWMEVDGGKHPLQAVREWRSVSLDQLAADTGIALEVLQAHEARRARASVDDLILLGRRLRVQFHLLDDEPPDPPSPRRS